MALLVWTEIHHSIWPGVLALLVAIADVADGWLARKYNCATTTGGLRDTGFGRAVAAGQSDAGLNLGGQVANQGAGLQTALANAQLRQNTGQFNAGNDLDAQRFNNQLLNQRQQFDVNASYQGDAGRDAAAAASAGVTGQAAGINAANAGALAGLGGQTFQQLLAALSAGTPLFGTSTTGATTGATTGTSSGTTTGSGTSSGNTSGNSSSKGGGLSF
jgi:hypothetical protein